MLRVLKIAVLLADTLSQGLKAFLSFYTGTHCVRPVLVERMADLVHDAANQIIIRLELRLTHVTFILTFDLNWDVLIR